MNNFPLRLTLLCHDIPYPPNHGGRVDMWTRLKALHSEGVQIQVICWTSQETTDNQITTLKNYCNELSVFQRNMNSVLNLITNSQYPIGVATHIVNNKIFLDQLRKIKFFNPNALILDGIHGAILALDIANQLKLPIIYRSHNIEYQHMSDQVKSSSSWIKKLRYLIDTPRMYKLEKIIRNRCDITYDICEEDSRFWQTIIGKPAQTLHPLIQEFQSINEMRNLLEQSIDILYIGNLHNPNNLNGLRWFILQVLPHIYTKRKVRVVIAGSNPDAEFIRLSRTSEVEVIENPHALENLYANAKVLINPILNVSGINIKTVEMLSTGNSLVVTEQAMRGIPLQLRKFVKIANTEAAFAEAILEILSIPTEPNKQQQALVRQEFGREQIFWLLKNLANLVN